MREIVIEHNDSGQRLDRFLRKYLSKAPLSLVYKLVRKDVKVNGKRAKEDTFLNEGDVLTLYMPDEDIEGYVEKKRPRSAKRQFKVDAPRSLPYCLSPLDQSAQISAPHTLKCWVTLTNLCGKYNCLAGSFLSALVNALKAIQPEPFVQAALKVSDTKA